MIKFPKQVTAEFFEYTTPLSVEAFAAEVEKLINRKWHDLSSNLCGKKNGINEFTITAKWEFGGPTWAGFLNINTPTNLKLYIFKNSNNLTQVNLLVTPNSYFPLLFILLPIFVGTILFMSKDYPSIIEILSSILLIVSSPFIILFFSGLSKRRLKTRFVSYFRLMCINKLKL